MGQIWCKLGQMSRRRKSKTNEALLEAPHHGPRELGLAGSQMGLERWEACRRCGSPHGRATRQQASGELYCSSLKKNASGGEVQREPRRGKALEVRWLELRQGEGMASCGEARDGWIRGRVARSERWCEERSTGCAGRRRREFEPWQPGLLPARETDRA